MPSTANNSKSPNISKTPRPSNTLEKPTSRISLTGLSKILWESSLSSAARKSLNLSLRTRDSWLLSCSSRRRTGLSHSLRPLLSSVRRIELTSYVPLLMKVMISTKESAGSSKPKTAITLQFLLTLTTESKTDGKSQSWSLALVLVILCRINAD